MQRLRQKQSLMLVAIALLITLLAVWYGQQYWRIATDGAATAALSVKPERDPALGKTVLGDPHRYFASYRYVDADGREHAARQIISRDLYESLMQRPDRPLTVHYSRSRPDVNVLDIQAARSVPIILAALAGAIWIAPLVRLIRG